MLAFGIMSGSLGAGLVSDRFGRRLTVAIGALMTIAGASVCYFTDHTAALESRQVAFLMGKIIVGAGLGLLLPNSQTCVSEVTPLRIRVPLLSLFSLLVVRYICNGGSRTSTDIISGRFWAKSSQSLG